VRNQLNRDFLGYADEPTIHLQRHPSLVSAFINLSWLMLLARAVEWLFNVQYHTRHEYSYVAIAILLIFCLIYLNGGFKYIGFQRVHISNIKELERLINGSPGMNKDEYIIKPMNTDDICTYIERDRYRISCCIDLLRKCEDTKDSMILISRGMSIIENTNWTDKAEIDFVYGTFSYLTSIKSPLCSIASDLLNMKITKAQKKTLSMVSAATEDTPINKMLMFAVVLWTIFNS